MASFVKVLSVAVLVTTMAACAPQPPNPEDPETVVFVLGDSGASLAGHPGLTVLGNATPLPGYVPWNWDDGLEIFPGYHPSGYVNAGLAERGIDAQLVTRAVWGSHGSAWAQSNAPVCDPDGERCGKSPGEIADEIAGFRADGKQVIIWFSVGVAPLADALAGATPALSWNNTAAWDQRLATERDHIETAISILRSGDAGVPIPAGAPEPAVILPGYANLSVSRPTPLLLPCGLLSRTPFELFEAGIDRWDSMLNPLINGGGSDLYDGAEYLGTAHPSGVSGVLSGIAGTDPTIAHVNPGLALVESTPATPPWTPSPHDSIKNDCIHLSSSGAHGLVEHVLDGALPQLGW